MRFELKAITSDGRVEWVAFQAADRAAAIEQLQGRGYTVLSVRARRALVPWGAERFPDRKSVV